MTPSTFATPSEPAPAPAPSARVTPTKRPARAPADHPAPRGRLIAAVPVRKATKSAAASSPAPARKAAGKASKTGKPSEPPASKKPLRFERNELPLFLLLTLSTFGTQTRPALTCAAFTATPTKLNKQRVNSALSTILEKKLVEQRGTSRFFTYTITREGRAHLRQAQKDAALSPALSTLFG